MAAKKKTRRAGRAAGPEAKRDPNARYSANQIWLAGLGAMARTKSSGYQIFEDLIKEGARAQTAALSTAQKAVMQAFRGAQKTVDQKVGGVRHQAQDTWDNLEKIFQTRVQRALHQLGMPTAEEISALAQRVHDLNQSVDKLAGASKAARKPASKPARRARKPAAPAGGEQA